MNTTTDKSFFDEIVAEDIAYLTVSYQQRVELLERIEFINQQNIYKIGGTECYSKKTSHGIK